MTEPTPLAPEPRPADLRWQAFFRRSTDPVFVLDRRRRVLFVNPAWETLAATSAAAARALVCRRPRPTGPDESPEAILEHALTPPPEVLEGKTAHVRRLLPGRESRRCWDVEFFPLRRGGATPGLLILGRITPVAAAEMASAAPLPESLVSLREGMTRRYGPELLTGAAPGLRRLAEQVRLAAVTSAPVLLIGEPGTGKRTLARCIHYQGPTRERPFAALDCTRLPAAALAEVLFGDANASFGAIYLHEPSHLPRDFQLRLCERLRAASVAHLPRFLAGCGADPVEEVRAGRLLDELYSSLAVLTLSLLPLRERMGDLPSLVDWLLQRCNAEGQVQVKGLTADAWEVIRAHTWPGNLRELHTVLAAARRHARADRITAADLPASLRLQRRLAETPAAARARPLPLDALLEEAERRLMELAIRRAGGNKKRAADLLSIPRPRIWRRLKALGLLEEETSDTDESGEE
jgi:transcriptional regulator with PAS, ATPase and Fis domain